MKTSGVACAIAFIFIASHCKKKTAILGELSLGLLHGFGADSNDLDRLKIDIPALGGPQHIHFETFEGPFSAHGGRAWFRETTEFSEGQLEVKKRIEDLSRGTKNILGFSQGATMAVDAAFDSHLNCVVALSAAPHPLGSWKDRVKPNKSSTKFFVAHGTGDSVISIDESRKLKEALEENGNFVEYVEFNGRHEIPTQVLRQVAAFLIQCSSAR
jgi:predicted esterase